VDSLGIQVDRCTHHYYTVHCIHREMDCMGLLVMAVRLNEEQKRNKNLCKNKTQDIYMEKRQVENNSTVFQLI
jgi:hypothetical protein